MSPKAPPIDGDWLNGAAPAWRPWRGQVGVVVFWSSGDPSSISLLQKLKHARNEEFPDLVVVGVHSPQTSDEFDRSAALDSVRRYELDFAVLHDFDQSVWATYNPPGWPTAVVISKRGRAVGLVTGNDESDLLFDAIRSQYIIGAPKKANRIEPVWAVETARPALAWPSGVCPLGSDRVAVSDYGNRRILIFDLLNESAPPTEIPTDSPPGPLCATGATTFAASFPESGEVRGFDLADPVERPVPSSLLAEKLGRPAGLALDRDGSLVVADPAGDRLYRIRDGRTLLIAGYSRRHENRSKSLTAILSQPTGVASLESGLAFSESNPSSLRLLTDSGRVVTVTPTSVDRPGLVDGPLARAALLRPGALVALNGTDLLLVDRGNGRLRTVRDRRVETLAVRGLSRPEDACLLEDGRIMVADTGNHRLVLVDLEQQKASEFGQSGARLAIS